MAAAGKYRPRDWTASNDRVVRTAQSGRDTSRRVREEALELTRETTSRLQRQQRDVQNQLSLRIDDIRASTDDLDRHISETFNEIGCLSNCKDMVEQELRAKDLPTEITGECDKLRDGRQGIDLVDDAVDAQLEKEARMLAEVKDLLRSKVDECVEQLRLLRAAKFQLEEDRKDKVQAHDVDDFCSQLDETSRLTDYFQEAVQIHPSSVNPEDWSGYTGDNIKRATDERNASIALREEIDAVLKETNDRLTQQANEVETAFNARIAEYNDSRNHMRVQLAKTQQEIAEQDRAINDLENAIHARQAPLKVATTRLEKRAQRPNVELVKDPAQYSLVNEVQEIERAIEVMQVKLNEAEEVHRSLVRAELALEADIQVKTNSLNIDNQCMLRRQQFKYRLL